MELDCGYEGELVEFSLDETLDDTQFYENIKLHNLMSQVLTEKPITIMKNFGCGVVSSSGSNSDINNVDNCDHIDCNVNCSVENSVTNLGGKKKLKKRVTFAQTQVCKHIISCFNLIFF